MAIVVISPEAFWQLPGPFVDILKNAGHEVRYPSQKTFTRGNDPDELTLQELAGATAVIAGGERLHAEVLRQLPDLRVIARCGVGYDRVDVPAASDLGKVVTITPFSNHEAVAEHAFALILGLTKYVALNDRRVRAGGWSTTLTKPIRGQTLGLIGLGRIGRSTAMRGVALGMKVIAHEMFPDTDFVQKHGIELVDRDELLSRSDFVSLHCPLNDETRGMCNAAFFSKMKRGAALINTARGGMVIEADLIAALESGQVGGAGLDVFDPEPPLPDNQLFGFDNVVLTPHQAGTDERSMEGMGVECAENIVALLSGQWPEASIVNKSLKEQWLSEFA